MAAKFTAREEAEAIQAFGDELASLTRGFDRLVNRMSNEAIERINAIPEQDHLETVAKAFQAIGEAMSRACDEAEEADDRRRANPLERDFRRFA